MLQHMSRRAIFANTLVAASCAALPEAANAEKDCFKDCSSNCNRVAPGSFKYCESSCGEYCLQDDRRDGLSGSIDSSSAEVGWLSGFDIGARVTGKQRLVPYGEDRPPALSLPAGLQDVLKSAALDERRQRRATAGKHIRGHAAVERRTRRVARTVRPASYRFLVVYPVRSAVL